MTQTATYKGRKYRCLFAGKTKYGRRAHLEFFDGSKSFWVDAHLVSVSGGESKRDSFRRAVEEGRIDDGPVDDEGQPYRFRRRPERREPVFATDKAAFDWMMNS